MKKHHAISTWKVFVQFCACSFVLHGFAFPTAPTLERLRGSLTGEGQNVSRRVFFRSLRKKINELHGENREDDDKRARPHKERAARAIETTGADWIVHGIRILKQ